MSENRITIRIQSVIQLIEENHLTGSEASKKYALSVLRRAIELVEQENLTEDDDQDKAELPTKGTPEYDRLCCHTPDLAPNCPDCPLDKKKTMCGICGGTEFDQDSVCTNCNGQGVHDSKEDAEEKRLRSRALLNDTKEPEAWLGDNVDPRPSFTGLIPDRDYMDEDTSTEAMLDELWNKDWDQETSKEDPASLMAEDLEAHAARATYERDQDLEAFQRENQWNDLPPLNNAELEIMTNADIEHYKHTGEKR